MNNQKKVLAKIKKAVKRVEPESEIILFGSRARGDAREDSDWDLLILVPDSVDLKKEQKFRHILFELELQFGLAISTFVHSKIDWESKYHITPLYYNIKQEGLLL